MKYYTENELQNFRFEGAYIAETCAVNGIFEMILDNVTILPQNSCNRDIREMRANELKLKIREPEITAFVEEGYKVFDADGVSHRINIVVRSLHVLIGENRFLHTEIETGYFSQVCLRNDSHG